MTGFGRTGAGARNSGSLFASIPRFRAAGFSLCRQGNDRRLPRPPPSPTQAVFDAFLGGTQVRPSSRGHSFTANPLGPPPPSSQPRPGNPRPLASTGSASRQTLRSRLTQLWSLPTVGDIRQEEVPWQESRAGEIGGPGNPFALRGTRWDPASARPLARRRGAHETHQA